MTVKVLAVYTDVRNVERSSDVLLHQLVGLLLKRPIHIDFFA
jgi:hypothetical protein